MQYNKDKVDEMALALLFLTTYEDKTYGLRAWKEMDWDVTNRLHEKGYISNPKSKARSVGVTEEGAKLSEELFKKYFAQ